MRIAFLAATVLLAAPALLNAQRPGSSTDTAKTRGRVYTSSGGSVTATPRSHMNAVSSTRTAAPETVYVAGTVTGERPTGTNYVITGTRSVLIVDTVYTPGANMSNRSDLDVRAQPGKTEKPDLEDKVSHDVKETGGDISRTAKKAGKDISREARRTPKNVDKLGRKIGHGAKEAASDVKKAVTKKP